MLLVRKVAFTLPDFPLLLPAPFFELVALLKEAPLLSTSHKPFSNALTKFSK